MKRLTLSCLMGSIMLVLFFNGAVQGQGISPALEQEFLDAKAALASALAAKADQYEPEKVKRATECLGGAGNARSAKDAILFSQLSHMARVLAESAKASTELRIEQEKLAETRDDLRKIKAEIQRRTKSE